MEKRARREAHVDHAPQFRLVPGKYVLVLPWLADAIRTDAAASCPQMLHTLNATPNRAEEVRTVNCSIVFHMSRRLVPQAPGVQAMKFVISASIFA